MTRTLNPRVSEYLHLLRCPACGGGFEAEVSRLECGGCGRSFSIDSGIPRLFWSRDEADKKVQDVTGKIRAFYEENPFPDYEEFDDLASLLEKAREGVFARLLDEQIPFGARVLECGCGTGQLSNFLGIAHRTVIGTDLSLASLELAEEFRARHHLERVFFLQMNLFSPVFGEETFDYVLCNGVLHHTADPREGFRTLARLLRPGGYLIVGLYHRFGRLLNDLRRAVFSLAGNRWTFLDPRLRKGRLGEARKAAWFADQYRNPHESKHTVSEVLDWIEEQDLTFVKSIPKTRLFSDFSPGERLFEEEPPGIAVERQLKESMAAFVGASEGGFFTVIARKG